MPVAHERRHVEEDQHLGFGARLEGPTEQLLLARGGLPMHMMQRIGRLPGANAHRAQRIVEQAPAGALAAERILARQAQIGRAVEVRIDNQALAFHQGGAAAEEAKAITGRDHRWAESVEAALTALNLERTLQALKRAGHPEGMELAQVGGGVDHDFAGVDRQFDGETIHNAKPG